MPMSTRDYRIESVDLELSGMARSHARKKVACELTRLDDGRRLKVVLRGAGRWKVGQIVALQDDFLQVALWQPPSPA
jgi:hypothetical protein